MNKMHVYMTTQPEPSDPPEDEETAQDRTDRDLEYIEED